MMNKADFKKLLQKVRGSNQDLYTPRLMNPVRDWWIGLGVSVLIFGVSAGWSASMYLKHRDMAVGEVTTVNESVVVYREAMVQSALEYFTDRQVRHEELIRAAQGINTANQPSEIIESSTVTEVDAPSSTETEGERELESAPELSF